ncbi:thioester domain-containing protein [Herbiconiux sp. CPCC 203407]|uniref:Thioester domain-containing protein n=1 Tax=Herbiconiux oxytropis TaxID=2970915 RepID=A0AA41XF92_9MICO|nr:thioester domain-containing protein [Herbiconiux oxytropis]MCS5724148.1 thioester domain-containing protein [Herbiconiux oxytropis]MCS5726917.1 thioester domain-containing protein [Herbiconiux oxytropis]
MNTPRGGRPLRRSRAALRATLVSALAVLASAALVLPAGQSAWAHIEEAIPAIEPAIGPDTEIRLVGTGPGQNIQGFEPDDTTPIDPLTPYPVSDPASGYQPVSNFAGTIVTASVSDPSLTAEMYCINLRVATEGGIGYESGTWAESNVPNIGYVTYILNSYYPTTDQPSGLTANQRAAAVQAAIWYFTDNYLVSSSSTAVRAAAAAIVTAAQVAGPLEEPPAPDLTITPATASAPIGASAGPYRVAAEGAADVTISAPEGVSLFADEAATQPLANPSTVASGTDVWLRSDPGATEEPVLRARAVVTVQTGEVYLYDGETPGLADAQRLILAKTAELDATAQATAEFFAVGELTVTKSFVGAAAGQQAAGRLEVDCGEGYTFDADVVAETGEAQTFTFPGIPVGAVCTVTEPVTGETAAVVVTSDAPQDAVITDDGASIEIVNTVEFRPGSLVVKKVIDGSAAGLQGEIVLDVDCGPSLQTTVVIPAGSPAGEYAAEYPDLPAGAECTITEPEDGRSSLVLVETSGPVNALIEPGSTTEAVVTNTVEPVVPVTPAPPVPDRPSHPAAPGGNGPTGLASTGSEIPWGPAGVAVLAVIAGFAFTLREVVRRRRTAPQGR